jgi:RNA polymerase sigma factor (sigma-70 family)
MHVTSLIDKVRARDEAAIREVYERHKHEVHAFLRRLCGSQPLADDLFQETWLQLVRYAHTLRNDSNLGAWLCVVARNTFRKHRRFVLVDEGRIKALRWLVTDDSKDDTSAFEQETEAFERGLRALPPSDREIILFSLRDDLTQDALAQMLDLAPATFRQRLSRAKKRLTRVIEVDK